MFQLVGNMPLLFINNVVYFNIFVQVKYKLYFLKQNHLEIQGLKLLYNMTIRGLFHD